MLSVQSYRPKILHQYIENFSVYHFGKDEAVPLYPKGVFEIVFQSNDCFEHNTSYSSGWENRPKSFVGGLHNKSYSVKPSGKKNTCIVVEFKPNTAKFFIPYKLHHFQNNVVDVGEIWGDQARQLTQRMTNEKEDHHKVKWLEDFFLNKFNGQQLSVIDDALQFIFSAKGFIAVNQLATKSGLSVAQFRKRFREEIGISPSQYCKIVRIKSTLDILQKGHQSSLTELTYQLGYFDQAHFIKDFKSVTGASPKRFKG